MAGTARKHHRAITGNSHYHTVTAGYAANDLHSHATGAQGIFDYRTSSIAFNFYSSIDH